MKKVGSILNIAIASGKGGTGKTSVAVNLALSLENVQVLDCDVEEPNVHLLLNPEIVQSSPVELQIPKIIENLCDYCGDCSDFCKYNALFIAGETILVFPELCHSCGGCSLICPKNAIKEETRKIGRILQGSSERVDVVIGEINVGEALVVPVIAAVKKRINENSITILDAPPGSACSLVETVYGTDFCVMVTEPTPFGLHDLAVAVEIVQELGIPIGVVVNFAGIGDRGVYDFCEEKGIPIMMEIPFSRRIAELYSNGIPFVKEMPEWKNKFQKLIERVRMETFR